MRFSLSLVVFLLMSFLPSFLGSTVAPTTQTSTATPAATFPSTHSTPDDADELLTTTYSPRTTSNSLTTSTSSGSMTTAKSQQSLAPGDEMTVLEEMSRLLEQIKEVATFMQEARDEHSRLAQAIAQISSAVKDMGEHNLHIKKKVRKMSKALRGGTHHRKVKDGLKSLQRDHQRILHAMSLQGINVTRSHNHNHTHNGTHNKNKEHHNHNRNHRDRDSNEASGSASNGSSGDKSNKDKKKNKNKKKGGRGDDDDKEEHKNTSQESSISAEDHHQTSSQGPQESLPEASVTDNLIPDLVVDPPGGTDPPLPLDCTEVMQRGNWTSGTYMIHPKGLPQPIKVWCDHTTNGGGWTIILARQEQDTQENFDRNWAEYKIGFGDPAGEHWIGLDALHTMTKGRNNELRVNITDWSDNEAWAEWKEFSVAGEDHFYRLKVNRYTSISQAGDALKWHNGMKFSTPDRDNDALMGGHCAKRNHGGWWYRGYRGCYQAHPTGRYQQNPSPPPEVSSSNNRNFDLGPVLVWQNWRGENYYPKTLFLMFRPSLN